VQAELRLLASLPRLASGEALLLQQVLGGWDRDAMVALRGLDPLQAIVDAAGAAAVGGNLGRDLDGQSVLDAAGERERQQRGQGPPPARPEVSAPG
jgi:hypothetical protein